MFMPKKSLGQIGEDVATEYLRKNGYKIIERNYKKPWGEIDVIAKKDNTIFFFEVKTLQCFQGKPSFLPEENVTKKKKANIKKTAQIYTKEKNIFLDYQIDVIGIEFNSKSKCRLRHTKNIH